MPLDRTGREGLMASDWGNELFVEAGKKIVDSLFVGASTKSLSDLGDRIECAFNLSFWEKEGAFDWSWLGLDLVNEKLVQTFLDIPWLCAAAALRLLQMCDLCDNGLLQLPAKCPWCSAQVTMNGYSLYMQLINYTAPQGWRLLCGHVYSGH